MVQEPLTSIISLPKAGIRSPADLAGKTVGTAGIDYQSAYLETILADAGVDPDSVKERNVGFNLMPALLTGRVDATLGAFWNYEGTELRLSGRRPRIIRMEEAGVPTYDELVLVANEDALERDGGKLRAFIGALSRGTRELRATRTRRRGAARGQPRPRPQAPARRREGHAAAVLPARGQPFGWQDPASGRRSRPGCGRTGCSSKPPDPRGAYERACCRRARASSPVRSSRSSDSELMQ